MKKRRSYIRVRDGKRTKVVVSPPDNKPVPPVVKNWPFPTTTKPENLP